MFKLNLLVATLLTGSLVAAEPVKIMPLGDSITYGGQLSGITPDESIAYRGSLWTTLNAAQYDVDFVGSQQAGLNYQTTTDPSFDLDNEGHNGYHAEQIASDITAYLPDANAADIVLLHIGTNDLFYTGEGNGATVAQTITDVNNILDAIYTQSPETKVILAQIINAQNPLQIISNYNFNLNSLVQTRLENGEKIDLVDMENSIDYNTDMVDNLHPNEQGYAKIANVWYDALKAAIPTHLWELDANITGTYIDSYRDANGSCTGDACPTVSTEAIKGSALSFDGNDTIDVANTTSFDWAVDASVSFEYWMKLDAADISGENQVIIGRKGTAGDAETDIWYVGVDHGSKKIAYGLGNANGEIQFTDGNTIVADGEWKHIVYTISPDRIKTYVNGQPDIDIPRTYPNTAHISGTDVNIGYLNWTSGFEYTGLLDELAVYDVALNDAQALEHYNSSRKDGLKFTTEPVTLISINDMYQYDANSSNDAENPTFSLLSAPSWMSIDPNTGVITGQPDAIGNVDVEIQVEVSSGTETAIQNYILRVRDSSLYPATMLHYWELNEEDGETVYMDAYSGADGTCATCPAQTAGVVAEAQAFNGGKMDVTDTETFDWAADDSITIEYWMKLDPSTISGENQVIIGRKGLQAPDQNDIWYVGVDASTQAVTYGLGRTATGGLHTNSASTVVADNDWHHVAFVITPTEFKVYVDGTLDKTDPRDPSDPEHIKGTNVNIGYLDWNDLGFEYKGMLDELVVFKEALSIEQIQEHYRNAQASRGFETSAAAPVLAEVTSVPTPDNNATPSYTFSTDEAGTIGYTGACASTTSTAVVGDNTIIFNVLADGVYNDCTLVVTDAASNASTPLDVSAFTVDLVAPVISMTGESSINLLLDATYTEAGATCTDNHDATCTVTIGGDAVDTSTVGNYTVTYTVIDTAGNAAISITRTVNVTIGNAPEITLTGANPYTVTLGSTYTDPGATATDLEDGTVNVEVNDAAVDTSKVGEYTVTYTATDAQGNTAQATRTVNVNLGNAPEITLTGANPYTVTLGSNYSDPGATATDVEDGAVTVTNDSDTVVNTSSIGSYTVTYTATDAHGNIDQEIRIVIVEDIDSDGDGIVDSLDPDDDNNGIDDVDEQTWFSYDGSIATIGTSSIASEDLESDVDANTDSITLTHTIDGECKAFAKALVNGTITTGYTNCTATNDDTLTTGTSFAAGSQAVIKKDGDLVTIETTVTLNANESFTIGGN